MTEPRVVSIIVPCRNERAHIEAFCRSALAQQLPEDHALELLIADGASDDGTRECLQALAAADPRLVVLDNPLRIVSTGLNLAIAKARGDVIVRMDVHTEYAPDYVSACLAALLASRADNVGGPWRAVAAADAPPMQRAIAAAFQSRWVAGGAASRRLDFDGWVDTVYLGCWPRSSLERFGLFDETLVRNQDDEHNLRIHRMGGRVWQSSRIRSAYRPRAQLEQVYRQYLQYGYWKPFVITKHRQAASWRQLVPAVFVVGEVVGWLLGLVAGMWWPLVVGMAAYALAVVAMTGSIWRDAAPSPWPSPASGTERGRGGHASPLSREQEGVFLPLPVAGEGRGEGAAMTVPTLLRIPLVIATYHVSYGIGSLVGWWDALVHRRARKKFATLTR